MEEDNSYKLKDCACENCDFEGEIELQKGTKLEQAVCSNCGISGGLYRKPTTTTYYEF